MSLQLLPSYLSYGLRIQDVSHWWGQDWSLTATGDIQTVGGIPRDNQRIFRRLCTNGTLSGARIGEYFFHPSYGGSASWYVGQTIDPLILEGIIRQQMYLEASVSHSPEPEIDTVLRSDGSYTSRIQYVNAQTGQAVPPLTMDVPS